MRPMVDARLVEDHPHAGYADRGEGVVDQAVLEQDHDPSVSPHHSGRQQRRDHQDEQDATPKAAGAMKIERDRV